MSSNSKSNESASHSKIHEERVQRPPYALSEEKAKKGAWKVKYKGGCFCGNVRFEIDQDPVDGCYCHCRTCQRLHGAAYQIASILPKDSIHFTSGADDLHFYASAEKKMAYTLPCKVSCGACQSPIMDEGRNMCLLFPTLIDGLTENENGLKEGSPFRASYHMFYKHRVEDIHDSLPKYGEKKGIEPLNKEAEEHMKELKKKEQEKEEKKRKEKEGSEDGEKEKDNKHEPSKRQKKE